MTETEIEPGNTLTLETTQGPVVIEMRPDLAPNHVAHIKKLVARETSTTASCSIASSTASWRRPAARTAPAPAARNIRTSRPSSTPSRMCAASAPWRGRRIPNSANSQFFICFDDARFLDRQYTVWGKVTSGMENVDKIKRGEPVRDPDKIVSATVS